MKRSIAWLTGVVAIGVPPSVGQARPTGPAIVCEYYPDSDLCADGAVDCALCHAEVPAHNAYGAELLQALGGTSVDPESFDILLPDALAAVEAFDSDQDGYSNRQEIDAGSWPGDPDAQPEPDAPAQDECDPEQSPNPGYRVCGSDPAFTLRRVYLDFCGHSPSFEQLQALTDPPPNQQWALVDEALARCLDSEHWMGKNGVLWQMAYPKIRPIGAIKGGPEDPGPIRGPDYYNDFNLYTYAHTDDHDVRDVLQAQYFVARSTDGGTRYERVEEAFGEILPVDRRVGMLTTGFFQIQFAMAALPRAAAAQAYRAYLGFGLERSEGLFPVAAEPADWDGKEVTTEECAYCHSTLDPLTYPFSRYGAGGRYDEDRLLLPTWDGYPDTLRDTPEEGVIFGEPVANLVEWGEVAANSDAFSINVVADYWERLVGSRPTPGSNAEFDALWRDLSQRHDYRTERMLADLIHTEAYSVP